ncbi:MAG: class I SAM-dependent methyltransferase [Chloroflexota bacterium]
MGRWWRAQRLLALPQGSRVLDLGCAFGFGTGLLAPRYEAYGHDLSGPYIERARRSVPDATFTRGEAESIPYPDAYFDGILLLDVLEHVPDDEAVVREIARALRPGGPLVVTVPNRGVLQRWDSLNVFARWSGPAGTAPTDDPSWPRVQHHRHYSEGDLRQILEPRFRIRGVSYTGVGVAEPVNLLLLLFRRKMPRLYEALQYLYFAVYLAEDLIPAGSWGYHLTLVADRA